MDLSFTSASFNDRPARDRYPTEMRGRWFLGKHGEKSLNANLCEIGFVIAQASDGRKPPSRDDIMQSFDIETYKVSSQLQRFPGETRPSRVLEMTGPVLYHGIQNHAFFAFNPFFDGVWTTPVAGYLTDGGYSGLSVVGWFPLAEYSYYYEILRNERPVQVIYDFRDAGATSGYLSMVGLGTSSAQIGHAPSESISAAMSNIARIVPMPIDRDLPMRTK
jgi:hypothetical protein